MGTGHNGGGPESTLDEGRVIEALRESAGIRSVAAQMLRIHRSNLHRFLKTRPHLLSELEDIDEEIKDLVEGKMLTAIRNDDGQMIRFFLQTRARDRGYGIKQEHSGPGGGPIPFQQRPTIDVDKLTFEQQKALLAATIEADEDADQPD